MSDDEINNTVLSLQAWQEGMANLAESIVWFQNIEATLSICIAVFSNMDEEIGEIVTSEMSFRGKIATLSALAMHFSHEDQLHEDISELFSRVRWAEQERNRLVHSMWDLNEEKPGIIERTKSAIRKNRHREDTEDLVAGDLEELRDIFEGINTDLIYLLSEHYPQFKDKFHY